MEKPHEGITAEDSNKKSNTKMIKQHKRLYDESANPANPDNEGNYLNEKSGKKKKISNEEGLVNSISTKNESGK
jgi:hypothetical protein